MLDKIYLYFIEKYMILLHKLLVKFIHIQNFSIIVYVYYVELTYYHHIIQQSVTWIKTFTYSSRITILSTCSYFMHRIRLFSIKN